MPITKEQALDLINTELNSTDHWLEPELVEDIISFILNATTADFQFFNDGVLITVILSGNKYGISLGSDLQGCVAIYRGSDLASMYSGYYKDIFSDILEFFIHI